jgi:predicted RNA-binding protein YlqC (UPF0109 family)
MLDKDATVREIQATSTLVVEIMPSSVSQAGRLVGRGGEVSEAIRRIARSMGQSARLDVLVSVARIDLPSLTPEHTP